MAERAPVRGTQSFLNIMGNVWRRPSLLGLEVLWRWAFGVPLLVVLAWEGWRIYSAAAAQLTPPERPSAPAWAQSEPRLPMPPVVRHPLQCWVSAKAA